MKSKLLLFSLLLLLPHRAVRAQNSDLAFQVGLSAPVSGTVSGTTESGSVGASFQFNYAVQLKDTTAGQLFLELPLLFDVTSSGFVSLSTTSNVSRTSIFFTPGVRWKFTPANRVSFYASGGGGVAGVARSANVTTAAGSSSSVEGGATPALGIAAGIDFRLTRLLSLRFEGRDDISAGTILGAHNHAFFLFGLAFHF